MTRRHSHRGHTGRAVFAVLTAALLFSTGGAVRALADFIGTSNQVACWRVLGGGAVMLTVALARRQGPAVFALMRNPLTWFMAVSIVLYQVTFFAGAEKIGIGTGTLIAQAVAPAVAGLLTWATGAGRPTLVWLACTAGAVAGMTLITGTDGSFDLVSVALVASSGSLYSINVVFGARLVRRAGVTGSQVLTASFALAALIALPVALQGLQWVATPRGLGTVLWAGVFATAIAYLLFGYGITHLPAPTVSTLAVSEPVWAALLGVFVLGEPMTGTGGLGCLVIIASLATLAWSQSRQTVASVRA